MRVAQEAQAGAACAPQLRGNAAARRRGMPQRARGHDGVVCGHIHRAEMREINGTLYCNDGDWVESRSALVEHLDGRLELLYWNGTPRSGTAVPVGSSRAIAHTVHGVPA